MLALGIYADRKILLGYGSNRDELDLIHELLIGLYRYIFSDQFAHADVQPFASTLQVLCSLGLCVHARLPPASTFVNHLDA